MKIPNHLFTMIIQILDKIIRFDDLSFSNYEVIRHIHPWELQ
jgi:hypothetical protein